MSEEKDLFTGEARQRIKEFSDTIINETRQEIEEQKTDTTKSGRKTKAAKEAEEAEHWARVLMPVLKGMSIGLKKVSPALEHSDTEIEVISTLGGKILPKHIDFDMIKYKEEAELISYLLMIEYQKIQLYLAEREDREKDKRNNNSSRKTGKRENTSD